MLTAYFIGHTVSVPWCEDHYIDVLIFCHPQLTNHINEADAEYYEHLSVEYTPYNIQHHLKNVKNKNINIYINIKH